METDASVRQASRLAKQLDMAGRLGLKVPGPKGAGCLRLSPAPDEALRREALRRLEDPISRLVDEIFWFSPGSIDPRAKAGLGLLALNRIEEARVAWEKLRGNGAPGRTWSALHDLAVFYHCIALDLEWRASRAALSGKEEKVRRGCWERAHARWQELLKTPEFYEWLGTRARELEDPRLVNPAAEVRDAVPEVLLGIQADLAARAAAAVVREEVELHLGLMRSAGYYGGSCEYVLGERAKPLCEQIRLLCQAAGDRADAEPKRANETTRQLLRDVESPLRTLDLLLPARDGRREAAHDDAVRCALRCQIAYANATGDWKDSLCLLEDMLEVTGTESMRERILENISIVRQNLAFGYCFFCGQRPGDDSAAYEVSMYGDVQRIPVWNGVRIAWKQAAVKVPRCRSCLKVHRRVDGCRAAGAVIGILAGVAASAACLHFGLATAGGAVGLALFASVVLGIAGGAMGSRAAATGGDGERVKPAGAFKENPRIKELLAAGWSFGVGPPGHDGTVQA